MANEVSKQPELAVQQMPEFLKDQKGGQGSEALSSAALTPPRLKLIQATSPELEFNEKLRPGSFFNNITEVDYGQAISIIPCYLSEAYFLFAPRVPGSPGGLLARAVDAVHWNPPNTDFEVIINKAGKRTTWRTAETVSKSKLDQWGTFDPDDPKSPPAAVHALNCLTLIPDDLDAGPSVLSFLRSALKVGKKFAGNLRLSRVPSFGRVFQLSSIKVEGQSGPYFEPRLKAMGFVGDVNLFNMAKEYYDMAKARGLDVDLQAEASEPAEGTGTADSDKY